MKSGPAYEYRSTIACQRTLDGGAVIEEGTTGCYSALIACAYQTPPSTTPLMNVFRRTVGPPPGKWAFVGTTCNPASIPGVSAPQAPTWAQIQTAFRELPFAKPRVHVQPEKNVTLVNLPTFYEVQWPADAATLGAGDTSEPIDLLGWSIRFKIAAQSYTYAFGDGTSSDPTTDVGGPYPNGRIRHSYTKPGTAAVKVDAKLTGQVSINGGPWEPIDTVADLTGEPVTTVTVREAINRLVAQ